MYLGDLDHSLYDTLSYIASAFVAICNAPSFVALPPMKPPACTKIHPGMPDKSDKAWSRTPLHLQFLSLLEYIPVKQICTMRDLRFWQRLSAGEAIWRDGHSLYSPFAASLLWVEDVKWLLCFRDLQLLLKQMKMFLYMIASVEIGRGGCEYDL